MATTDPALFARTVQETERWLDRLIDESDLATRSDAYGALRAVLHQLRDRLAPTEAAHLAAQLPTLVRGIYYEGWNPARAPQKIRDWPSFKAAVEAAWPAAARHDIDRAIRAVFAVLDAHVTQGELDDVRAELPPDIVAHWPRAA
ncbi:MAG: DUF2267 domain-containing protein [Alphaproteobacteria bacterium]